MAAFLAQAGVVADLIGGQAGSFGQLPGQLEQVGSGIVVQRGEFVLADHGGEPCAGLDRQLIK